LSDYNEDGWTKEDIDYLIKDLTVDDGTVEEVTPDELQMIVDALEFYRDTHYIG